MIVSKWPFIQMRRKMAIAKEVDSINKLKHSSDNTLKGQLFHDTTLLIWTSQFNSEPFFLFASLLSWQIKSSAGAPVNKVMHEQTTISLPLMPNLSDCGFFFFFISKDELSESTHWKEAITSWLSPYREWDKS